MKDANYKHRPLVAMSTTGKLSAVPPSHKSQQNRPRVRVQVRIAPQDGAEIPAAVPPPDEAPEQDNNGDATAYGVTESVAPEPPAVKGRFHFLKSLFAR